MLFRSAWLGGIRNACNEIGDHTMLESIENLAQAIEEILGYNYDRLTSDRVICGSRSKMMTRGFEVTELIAILLDKSAQLAEETGVVPSFKNLDRSETSDSDFRATFGALCEGKAPLTKMHNGNLGKVKIASPTGRNPRRIHRMLTDPHRRIFDRSKRNSGGVVLIDGSGSMHIESNDILKILNAAPGATVAMYEIGRAHV